MSNKNTCCALVAAVVISYSAPICAADIEFSDSKYGPGIYLTGEIVRGDHEKLQKAFYEAVDASGISIIPYIGSEDIWGRDSGIYAIRLYLNSRGGEVEEAFKIGSFVRKFYIITSAPGTRFTPGPVSTYIGEVNGGDELLCASSCAFIWLAGHQREGDRVAFHRPFEIAQGRARSAQELESSVEDVRRFTKKYLESIGSDDRIFPAVMSQSRDEAMWLTDLRKIADVPEFSTEFEEQIIERCGNSAFVTEDVANNFQKNPSQKTISRLIGVEKCNSLEIVKMQSQVYRDYLDERIADEAQAEFIRKILYGGLALAAVSAIAAFFWRRSRWALSKL